MRHFVMLLLAGALAAQTVNYTYDSAGRLTGVTYPNGKVLTYSYDPAGNLRLRTVGTPVAGAAPVSSAAGIANSGSFLGGPVAAGELVTIFGTGIGPASLITGVLTSFGFFDSYLSDTAVTFDGVPAPLIYVSGGQSTAIVPYAVAGKASTQMVIRYQGRSSVPITVPVVAAAPGLFSANSTGAGNGAILNDDNITHNGPTKPALKGAIVVLFGTGEGQTSPAGVDGRPANTVYPKPVLPLSVSIGGIAAQVLYYGAAPTLVAGVLQINVVVPLGVPSGNVPVVVKVGSFLSQSGLTVAVQ
jgi:uncharacterized protein (TIGR03437 family)